MFVLHISFAFYSDFLTCLKYDGLYRVDAPCEGLVGFFCLVFFVKAEVSLESLSVCQCVFVYLHSEHLSTDKQRRLYDLLLVYLRQ